MRSRYDCATLLQRAAKADILGPRIAVLARVVRGPPHAGSGGSMSLVRDLNHYNLRAPRERLAEVAAFYANVLGFEARWFEPANGYWLYAGERPLVHLQSRTGDAPPPPTTGVIDHVAFSCAGLAAATARLVAGAVPYAVRPYRELGFTQLVLADPLGVKIELNFNGEFPGPA